MEFLEAKIQVFKPLLVVVREVYNADAHVLYPNAVFPRQPGVPTGKFLYSSSCFARQYSKAVQITRKSWNGVDRRQEKGPQAAKLHGMGKQSIKLAKECVPRLAQAFLFTQWHIADVPGANQ